ncbi:uncharacterized protein LOC120534926 [Polypterus senegalus]|uniref:uncharacterized protein LOC120534926 n=1 Tax=Polypterus senegalus TaxID=55291 RepID=UPI0019638E74|nr:uncharacterized protein LOC120534926 [Polypterus senegalus]
MSDQLGRTFPLLSMERVSPGSQMADREDNIETVICGGGCSSQVKADNVIKEMYQGQGAKEQVMFPFLPSERAHSEFDVSAVQSEIDRILVGGSNMKSRRPEGTTDTTSKDYEEFEEKKEMTFPVLHTGIEYSEFHPIALQDFINRAFCVESSPKARKAEWNTEHNNEFVGLKEGMRFPALNMSSTKSGSKPLFLQCITQRHADMDDYRNFRKGGRKAPSEAIRELAIRVAPVNPLAACPRKSSVCGSGMAWKHLNCMNFHKRYSVGPPKKPL